MSSIIVPTYADLIRPHARRSAAVYDAAMVAAGAVLVAAAAQVVIPLAFTPVPITGATFGVLFVAMALGTARGTAASMLYVGAGVAGAPVFLGFSGGFGHFSGPTGGYIVGYIAASLLVGRLARLGWDRSVPRTIAAMALGNLVIYLFGVTRLSMLVGGIGEGLRLGMVPFLIGDAVKILLAAALLPAGWKLIRARHDGGASDTAPRGAAE